MWLTYRYMANFPRIVRTKFFEAVNARQAAFIKEDHRRSTQSADPETFIPSGGLSDLPASIGQLLLGTPSLLDDADIAAILDSTIEAPNSIDPSVVFLGLTPVLVHFLSSSSQTKRHWARRHLAGLSRQPLTFDDWCNLGIGVQIQALYSGGSLEIEERLGIVTDLLSTGSLQEDVVKKGLLDGVSSLEQNARSGKSLMAVIAPLLGAPSEGESPRISSRGSELKYQISRHCLNYSPPSYINVPINIYGPSIHHQNSLTRSFRKSRTILPSSLY